MTNDCTPYIPSNPGDLITAEDWNEMQCKVKEDIAANAAATKEEIIEHGVSRADNADKFDGRSPAEWTEALDQRYSTKVHDHEGVAGYRRFIKRFTPELDKVLLHHKLGRFPLVDIYRLESLGSIQDEKTRPGFPEQFQNCKLFFYYGHADAEKYGLQRQVYREKIRIGIPFHQLLDELAVEYDDNDPIEDVLNDMWDAFMHDPNDQLDHCQSPWVRECCGQRRTVAELKRGDQWNDLYVAMIPVRVLVGDPVCLDRDMPSFEEEVRPRPPDNVNIREENNRGCRPFLVQVNYQTVYLEVQGLTANNSPVDLMILMRS